MIEALAHSGSDYRTRRNPERKRMKIRKIVMFVSFAIVAVLATWLVIPKQKAISEHHNDIDEFILDVMEEAAIPGMGIAVIRNGNTELIRAYGFADIEKKKPATIDTPFNIASISKPIMGIAILQLAERGHLNLDDDINTYLPFKIDHPSASSAHISIRQLATHTSGIADFYDPKTYSHNADSNISLKEHVEKLLVASGSDYYLPNPPGTTREYSNLGAAVAGLIVESTSGQSLSEYSRENIFLPLGMADTGWLLADFEGLGGLAVPYEVEQCIPYISICANWKSPIKNGIISELFNPPIDYKTFQRHPHYGNPQYPDGGIRTSINDLNTLILALLDSDDGDTVFSDSLKGEMLAKQLTDDIDERQRFFWRDNLQGRIGHKGADIGVFSSLYFDPVKKDAVIIVMNRGVDMASDRAMDKLSRRLWSM